MRIAKFYCAVLAALLFAGVSTVKSQSFEQGKVIISGGYGFGNLAKTVLKAIDGLDAQSNYELKSVGPFFGKFEYAVSDKIGLGINVAHIGLRPRYDFTYTDPDTEQTTTLRGGFDWANTSVLARINIHFSDSDKFDAYWGAGLGYRFGGTKAFNNKESDLEVPEVVWPFGFETTFGTRYYITPNLGVYGEIGFAKAIIQFGVSGAF